MITSCEAVVIGITDYGEADRIAVLFSPEIGKFSALARGARKSRRRFAGCFELFARLALHVRLKEGLSSVDSADCLGIYPGIRTSLSAIAAASYACEITGRFLPERYPSPRLYRLLSAWLDHLDSGTATPSDRLFFDINLLNILGYRPSLDHCCSCGSDLASVSAHVAAASGEIVCMACGGHLPELPAAVLVLLRRALGTGRFGAVPFPAGIMSPARNLVDRVIDHHLDRPLRTRSFVEEMERE